MAKNNIIKIVAVLVMLLFLISGFSVLKYESKGTNFGKYFNVQKFENFNENEKSLKAINGENNLTEFLTNLEKNGMNFGNYPKNVSLYRYNSNYNLSNAITQDSSEITETAASSGLQVNSICYGDGIYLVGGENTSSSPLLIEYNASNGNINDLSSKVPLSFKYITTISYYSGIFYLGGIPNNNQWAFAMFNFSNNSISSLGSAFPILPSGPNIYASAISCKIIYIAGYYQTNGQDSFLFTYNVSSKEVQNLSAFLPQQSAMALTLSSNKSNIFVAGIFGNYSSFAEIYNATTNSKKIVNLPSGIESLGASTFYNGNFFVGGSSLSGGELLEISNNCTVKNFSSFYNNYIQIITLSSFDGSLFAGGWGPNGSFATLLTIGNQVTVRNITLKNGWAANGSELLASASDGSEILIGGAVTTQFFNYTGALLGIISGNLTCTDMSNRIPKTYTSVTYSYPPQQDFYVYAYPNIVTSNGSITFYGQNLEKNASYELSYASNTISIETNSQGSFSYSVKLNDLRPGDYQINLTNGNKEYYNYFAVLYNYSSMIYGSKIPKTMDIGYSNLREGAVVRDGQYIEFYRQTDGNIPVTSINYLVQWNQILFQNLTSKGWTVAPVNQLGYASQFSINPLTFQYSFWNDYGIVEVSTSGKFTGFSTSNSYIYISGNEMIVWIPYSIVNETKFPWAFATDYVQNSPVYNFNYRIEAGQSYVSWYYGNETPSLFYSNRNAVEFIQSGYPTNENWEVSIINDTGSLPSYYQNYSTYSKDLIINLPNGKYSYEVFAGDSLYTTSNATGYFILNNNNFTFNITFQKSPITIYMQHYTTIQIGGSLEYNATSIIGNYGKGPYAFNFGVMNSTFIIKIINSGSIIYNSTISGNPFSYVASQISKSYGYLNFNYSGGIIEIIATNIGNKIGYFAFNIWNYFISNYTASLITIPPQFSENFNPPGNFTEMY
ncbi:MAG: hypothetical protein ACP5LA_07000, partial [Thermoplasmata archaeon]